ncbi:cysteine/glutathione ABC transporter membrane /ATP-binding component, partial [Mesomycoplasma hyorhinis]
MLAVYPSISKEIDAINFILNVEREKIGEKLQEIKKIEFKQLSCNFIIYKKIFSIKNLIIDKNLILEGRNGAGKSSLLRILNLDQDYKGDFFVNDLNVNFYNKEFLREQILYIKNENYFPKTDIFSYITYAEKKKVETFLNNIQNYDLQPLLEQW